MEQRERVAYHACRMGMALMLIACMLMSCGPRARVPYRYQPPPKDLPKAAKRELPRMGFTIQAGAFAKVENAFRLTETLRSRGLDATYFVARDGLYKVRFGNFTSKELARSRAENLQAAGVIEAYYIVAPEDYAVTKSQQYGEGYLREEIIKTARSFIGVPYLWGGTSVETGFDCSGLTMTVYQLNGLNLPRSSREQFETGLPIPQEELMKGDLIFFATTGPGKVSHVGIYVGDGEFIHAPGRGKTIRKESLSAGYFKKHLVGARSYL